MTGRLQWVWGHLWLYSESEPSLDYRIVYGIVHSFWTMSQKQISNKGQTQNKPNQRHVQGKEKWNWCIFSGSLKSTYWNILSSNHQWRKTLPPKMFKKCTEIIPLRRPACWCAHLLTVSAASRWGLASRLGPALTGLHLRCDSCYSVTRDHCSSSSIPPRPLCQCSQGPLQTWTLLSLVQFPVLSLGS